MNRNKAIELIRISPLAEHSERLIAGLQEALALQTERAGDLNSVPLGGSRMGGVPDLPPGVEWPSWVGSGVDSDLERFTSRSTPPEKRWLNFLAQIRLNDLPDFDQRELLPRSCTLYFFYDVEIQPWALDRQNRAARVLFSPADPASMVRTPYPGQEDQYNGQLCALRFIREWSLPEWSCLEDSGAAAAQTPPDFSLERDDLLAQLNPHLQEGDDPESYFAPVHRLLGYPDTIQTDMRMECELASAGFYIGDERGSRDPQVAELRAAAKDWRLLLQIDTDEDGPGWMWGDAGRIYFWIRERDLRQRHFDHVWLMLQCS